MFWVAVPFVVLIFVISFLIIGEFFGAPWAPTRKKLVHKMLSMGNVGPGDVLFDLGSGDGRLSHQTSSGGGVDEEVQRWHPKHSPVDPG